MTVLAIEKRRAKAWWKELWVQVLIAMAIGVALGITHPDLAISMQPLGDAFIKAIRMLIAPIIFCTVVHGIAHMADMARVGRVAIKAIVMWVAPIGAFGAIAFTVGKFGVGSLASLGKLLAGFYLTCVIFVIIALGPVARYCGMSLVKLIRYFWEELLICIATTSSETVLPRMITKLEDLGCEEGVVGLVIPTGYSFNLDGTCLYLAAATVFLAQATNTPLDLSQQVGLLLILLVTSKGAAGVACAAFVVLAATLSATGAIPVASVALVLGIHRLMSQALRPTNLLGNAVATIAIAKWENALEEDRIKRVLNGETLATATA